MLVNRHIFSLMAVCLTVSLAADAAVMDRWHAGTWDSTAYSRAEHPKTVAIRMELLDKDTHIPISGVQVSLRGEYWQMWVSQDIAMSKDVPWWNILVDPDKREPQPREFRLDAVSGPDGVVVFALPWQKEFPWDTKIGDKWTYKVGDQWIVYVDDVEKVQRLEIRHPQYKYFDSPLDFKHLVGLEQYIEARKSGENIEQKFEAGWKGEISRKNVKLFVLDLGPEFGEFRKQACQRPEFFQKVRVKDYGLVYRNVENLWNLQGQTQCGPYFVYDLGEVLLEPVAVRVSVGPAGNNILTREDNKESTPRPSRPPGKADNATVSGQGAEQVRDTSPTQTPSPAPVAPSNTRTEEGRQYVAIAQNDPLGVAVADLKKERAQSLGLPPTVATNFAGTEGMIVEYVAPGSLASDVGLTKDCILTIMWIDGYEKHLFDDKDYRDAVDLISKKRAENLKLQYWQFPVPFNGEIDYPNHLKTVEIYLDPDRLPAAFQSAVPPSPARSAVTESTPQQPQQEPQAPKIAAPPLPKLSLPSLDELKADAAKLRAIAERARAMKGQLVLTAIRALPLPDPDTGQMTTLDAYARKLAAGAGVGGSLGEDPVATAYMMLFDSSFLTDQARIIKLPDGKYVPLVEAIGIATGNSAKGLDSDVLNRALSAVTDLQQAQRAGNGELLTKALTKLFFAVSETNASGGGAPVPTTALVSPGATDAGQPAPPAGAGPTPTGKTVDLGNGIRMEFVLISAGTFYMGSPSSETGRSDDEGPARRVQISKAFYMSKCEVTQDQYMAVMGANPSKFSGRDLPVEQVSWDEAVAFCGRIGGRLPTEAEWEYACRAGSSTRYCFGDSDSDLGQYAWYDANSGKTTHPVGQKKPNSFGLYDMHGNVWEWCQDWYGGYQSATNTDPKGLSSGKGRVCRGGSWSHDARYCRSASRSSYSPGLRCYDFGFRVALDSN